MDRKKFIRQMEKKLESLNLKIEKTMVACRQMDDTYNELCNILDEFRGQDTNIQ